MVPRSEFSEGSSFVFYVRASGGAKAKPLRRGGSFFRSKRECDGPENDGGGNF